MTDLLGLGTNTSNAITTRPANGRSYGSANTWFKDCTSAAAQDGTALPADWFNTILAQLRTAIVTAGVVQNNADDTMLWQAMVQAALQNAIPTLKSFDFYVNGTTGNDGNLGTQNAPFASVQAAITYVSNFFSSQKITIHVAAGTYNLQQEVVINSSLIANWEIAGAGQAQTIFNFVYQTNGFYFNNSNVVIHDIGITAPLAAIYATNAANVYSYNINVTGTGQSIAFGCGHNAVHQIAGTVNLNGTFSQVFGSQGLMYLGTNNNVPLSCVCNSVSIGQGSFAYVTNLGEIYVWPGTVAFSGSVTGQRFTIADNSIIYTFGRGVNFFPGTVAGTYYTPQQYT